MSPTVGAGTDTTREHTPTVHPRELRPGPTRDARSARELRRPSWEPGRWRGSLAPLARLASLAGPEQTPTVHPASFGPDPRGTLAPLAGPGAVSPRGPRRRAPPHARVARRRPTGRPACPRRGAGPGRG